ncbi:unnamed protein product [Caenorhabditis brenneri]
MMNSEFRCRICGQNAHGNHFGVYSCRACAAFFRRTAKSDLADEECKKKGRKQQICLCKPCRLRKCINMGMTSEILASQPEKSSIKVMINVESLISEASRILEQGCYTPVKAENQLKKLNLGFKYLQFSETGKTKVYDKIGKEEFLDLIEFNYLAASKWIMHFDEFRKLEKSVQITLTQTIWHIWRKLHKCVTTVMFRKSEAGRNSEQKVMRNLMLSKGKTKIDTDWMSDYPNEYAIRYMLSQNMYDDAIINSIMKLDPTDIELTYMFAQLCFEYAGKRYPGEIQKITDHFQQILSNDLHDYYINDQKKERYFFRLNELMKVNNLIQRSIWESRPHRELGRVFDVPKIELSNPEMFEDSGFCLNVSILSTRKRFQEKMMFICGNLVASARL